MNQSEGVPTPVSPWLARGLFALAFLMCPAASRDWLRDMKLEHAFLSTRQQRITWALGAVRFAASQRAQQLTEVPKVMLLVPAGTLAVLLGVLLLPAVLPKTPEVVAVAPEPAAPLADAGVSDDEALAANTNMAARATTPEQGDLAENDAFADVNTETTSAAETLLDTDEITTALDVPVQSAQADRLLQEDTDVAQQTQETTAPPVTGSNAVANDNGGSSVAAIQNSSGALAEVGGVRESVPPVAGVASLEAPVKAPAPEETVSVRAATPTVVASPLVTLVSGQQVQLTIIEGMYLEVFSGETADAQTRLLGRDVVAGETLEVTVPFLLRTNNAGGVRVMVDGKNLGALGLQNEPQSRLFCKDCVKE